jgi:hypothetical protein
MWSFSGDGRHVEDRPDRRERFSRSRSRPTTARCRGRDSPRPRFPRHAVLPNGTLDPRRAGTASSYDFGGLTVAGAEERCHQSDGSDPWSRESTRGQSPMAAWGDGTYQLTNGTLDGTFG